MANAAEDRCRLCLVTPALGGTVTTVDRVADAVAEALGGGDVAALIVSAVPHDPATLERLAAALVPIASARGVAALVHGDCDLAARVKADGVHVDSGPADAAAAIAACHPARMVGVGGLKTRDDAMIAGETQPDYLFFGRLDGDTDEGIFPKALDLAAWWSSVTIIPAVVMGGRALASVHEAAAAEVSFVALRNAVWDDPRGPAAAVAEAMERLAATPVSVS